MNLLEEKAPCQKLEFENREYDGILYDPLAGLIATLALEIYKLPHNNGLNYLYSSIDSLLIGIDNHLNSTDEMTLSWVIGCYCQLIQDNELFTKRYVEKVLVTVYYILY